MKTYRELVYMCLDLIKLLSDDSTYTQDHIIYLLDKFRAALLKKEYKDIKKDIPYSNFQTVSVNVQAISGKNYYLRSTTLIPEIINIARPMVHSMDYDDGNIEYVSKERIRYVGENEWLTPIVYATIGYDNKLYLKNKSIEDLNITTAKIVAIFESPSSVITGDIMDADFPIEDALIPLLIESLVKELLGASYRAKDNINNGADDLSDLASFIRRYLKNDINRKIEGTE